ncbi:MAG: DUF167 domain-containing protein [Gemmatimonadetes bacterium]|nr:DUF167 domain-containing protein [Gemmatimonadota bacterium]
MAKLARLVIWVQPRASRTEVAGMHGDAVKIRLAAPPVDGAANEELIRLLADKLGVPRSAVSIAAGRSGRRKTVEVEGIDRATLEARLLKAVRRS